MCGGTYSAIAVAQPCHIEGRVFDADQRGEHVGAAFAGGGDDACDGGPHAGDALQRGLDVAEFDAVAADLHPVIGAADELQRAVGPVPGQVAGAVPGSAEVPDEAVRGEVGPASVARCDAASGDPELTGHPVRAIQAGRIHHAGSVVGEGHAVGHRGPALW